MKKSKNKHCIFISTNKTFLSHLKVCLLSIKERYINHPDIIICHTDLEDKEILSLKNIISSLIFIENDLSMDEVGPVMDHLPNTIDPRVFYARFMIWRHKIFRNYDNVLHLDADILVIDILDSLFRLKKFLIIRECYSGEDQIFRSNTDINLLSLLKKDNIPLKNIAGNGGVFLVPSIFRGYKYYKQLISILNRYRSFIKWADQSVINIWIHKNNFNIDTLNKYNFQHRMIINGKNDKLTERAKIIHFNGVPDKNRVFCMKKFYELIKRVDNYPEQYRQFYNSIEN